MIVEDEHLRQTSGRTTRDLGAPFGGDVAGLSSSGNDLAGGNQLAFNASLDFDQNLDDTLLANTSNNGAGYSYGMMSDQLAQQWWSMNQMSNGTAPWIVPPPNLSSPSVPRVLRSAIVDDMDHEAFSWEERSVPVLKECWETFQRRSNDKPQRMVK